MQLILAYEQVRLRDLCCIALAYSSGDLNTRTCVTGRPRLLFVALHRRVNDMLIAGAAEASSFL